jgi:hypothetical protein
MASLPRLILQFAPTAAIAGVLPAATPLMAGDRAAVTQETVARSVPSLVNRHTARVQVATSSYHHRRVSSIRGDVGCSGAWYGRQFVLMIGVGY